MRLGGANSQQKNKSRIQIVKCQLLTSLGLRGSEARSTNHGFHSVSPNQRSWGSFARPHPAVLLLLSPVREGEFLADVSCEKSYYSYSI